jgi:O-antigen/teichoic acid export membrane protein
LVCFGDALVRFLYDARYWQAAWMLPILALGLWPRLLCGTLEPALFAIGKPQYTTAAQATRVVWTVGGVLLGFALAGIFGAIAAIALNDLLYYLVIQVGLWREGLAATRQDAQVTFVFLLLIGAVLSARVLVGGRLPF